MNVLFLRHRDWLNPSAAGGDFYAYQVGKALIGRGHKVTFLCSKFRGCKSQETIEEITIVRIKDRLWPLSCFAHYNQRLKGRFDAVVEEIEGPRLPSIAALYVVEPLVGIWYQRSYLLYREEFPIPIAFLLGALEFLLARLYRRKLIVLLSGDRAKDWLAMGIDLKLLRVVHPYANSSIPGQPRDNTRSNLVVTIGKLRKFKSFHQAVLAMAGVIIQHPDARLILAGKSGNRKYETWLRGLVESTGVKENVSLLVNMTNAERQMLLRKAKALIVPSPIEGFGLVTLEANIEGTPVLATDGTPKDAVEDGYNGLTYHRGEVRELTELITRILADDGLWQKLSSNAILHAASFTVERTGLAMEEALHEAAKHGLDQLRQG